MPIAPKRACEHPGCFALTSVGRKCPAHTRPRGEGRTYGFKDQKRTRHQRGYGTAWDKMRARVLQLHPFCYIDGCTKAATHVDHVIPKAMGGDNSDENLRGICQPHHAAKTAQEGAQGRQRRRKPKP